MTTPTVTELPRRSEATTMDPFNPQAAGVMMPGREPNKTGSGTKTEARP